MPTDGATSSGLDGVAVIVKVVGVGFGVGSKDCKGVGNPFEGKVFGRSGVGVVDKSTCAGVVVTDAESDNAEFSFCELHPNKSSSTMPSPHSLITAADFLFQLHMPLFLLLVENPHLELRLHTILTLKSLRMFPSLHFKLS